MRTMLCLITAAVVFLRAGEAADDILSPVNPSPVIVETGILNNAPSVWSPTKITVDNGVVTRVAEATYDAFAHVPNPRSLQHIQADLDKTRSVLTPILQDSPTVDNIPQYCVAAHIACSIQFMQVVPNLIDNIDIKWVNEHRSWHRGKHPYYIAYCLDRIGIPIIMDDILEAMHTDKSSEWWIAIECLLTQQPAHYAYVKKALSHVTADVKLPQGAAERIVAIISKIDG